MNNEELKELLWQSYWQGYKLGYGVEETIPVDKRAARSHFERWFDRNCAE